MLRVLWHRLQGWILPKFFQIYMRSRTREFDSEKSSIRIIGIKSLGSINKDMLIKDILLESSHFSTVAEDFGGDEEGEGWPIVCTLESKDDMNIIGLSKVSNLSSSICCWFSFMGWIVEDWSAEFFRNKIDEFIMVFNSCCWDNYSSRG